MSYNQAGFGFPPGATLVDVVPDAIRPLIHKHWEQFPPVNPMWHYILGVWYIVMGVVSFIGNGTVLYLFMKVKKLRTPTNILIANLALLDMGMLWSQFPWFAYNCFTGGVWQFSTFACEIYGLTGIITGEGSLWSHVFITWDRYNVIVHGVSGKPLTYTKAFAMVLFIWGYGVGIGIPPLFGWNRFIPEGILDSCSFDYLSRDWNNRSYGIFLFTTSFIVPLSTILFAYIFIVKAVVAHESSMRAQAKKMNVTNLRSGGTEGESAEMRVAKTACINVSIWLCSWTPYAAIVFQAIFMDQSKLTPIYTMIPALLCKTAACYSPMVYALTHPRFRAAMQQEVSWCCVNEPEGNPNDNKSNSTEAASDK